MLRNLINFGDENQILFPSIVSNDLYCLRKIYSMIHTSLPLDNMHLELQELPQIPYSRHIFMHKLSRLRQKRDKRILLRKLSVLKCITTLNYFL